LPISSRQIIDESISIADFFLSADAKRAKPKMPAFSIPFMWPLWPHRRNKKQQPG
jgi:hypothetical protein